MENGFQSRYIKTSSRGNIFHGRFNQRISIINSKVIGDTSWWRAYINKANKGIGIIRKLNNILPCNALWTIYRSFVRPDLDYGDVIYDLAENKSVSSKIERIQCNASLVITGAIRGTSQEKLYQELGLGSFRTRNKIFKAYVLLLQTNYNSKAIIFFNLIPPVWENGTNWALKFVIQTLTKNFRRQNSLLILSKFKRINEFLFPLKLSGNLWLFDDFRKNSSWLMRLNSLHIGIKIWRSPV